MIPREPLTTLRPEGKDHPSRIGSTEGELVHEEGTLRLIRFRPKAASEPCPLPMLLVMPVINRAFIADLTPAASLVASFRESGVDTYVIDWGRPGFADEGLGLDGLVGRLIPRCERRVLERSGAPALALAGYCLGGTLATCRAAHGAPNAPHGALITINAPVSFEKTGPLGGMTHEGSLPLEALLRAFGNMPGALLQQGFYALRPLQQLAKLRRLVDHAQEPGLVEELLALEAWNSDNVPVTGAFYRTLIGDLYRKDRLARGELSVEGRRLALGDVRCPVLVVAAKDDPICLPEQATALLDLVSSPSRDLLERKGGHVRSVLGSQGKGSVAPLIASWLRARKA